MRGFYLMMCAGTCSLALAASSTTASAKSYLYQASCAGSYQKQGEQSDDLTLVSGRPILCDGIVLALLDNGRVLIQFSNKASNITPLGFAGSGLDHDFNPNMVTLPIERIYLPHASSPNAPQTVGGVEGYCFLDGQQNIRRLSGITCVSKFEIGTQKLIYHIEAKVLGVGELVPQR